MITFSRDVLWKVVDDGVVDGSISGSADVVNAASSVARRQQSGLIRSYAAWVVAGALIFVAYMVWMGIR